MTVTDLHPGQMDNVAHRPVAGVDPSSNPSQATVDAQASAAGVAPSPAPEATSSATPNPRPPRVHGSLAEASLRILAENHTDFERTRIATENRLRALRQVYLVPEGVDLPEVVRLQATVDGMKALEHQAELDLKRSLRAHPLGPWVKRTTGIGEKQGARLIAAIGDPSWNSLHDRPRTVSELWAYCGYHVFHPGHVTPGTHGDTAGVDLLSNPSHGALDALSPTAGVAPARRRGQRANWNADAKMRAFLCAEAAVKAGVRQGPDVDDTEGYDAAHRDAISPLGAVYLSARIKYATATHGNECPRCGPKGKPALPGSPLSAGHQHARGLRLVAKEILKDLWREATALSNPSQSRGDTQSRIAGVAHPLDHPGHLPPDTHHADAGVVDSPAPEAKLATTPRDTPPRVHDSKDAA